MNVTIHPSQWFHHHAHAEHAEHGKLYQMLHSEAFWAVTILAALFAGAIALIVVFGTNPPSGFQYEPMYFP
jgi:hypothetical protein